VKHRVVFAVLTEIRNIFAEPYIFQVIRDKTIEATLNALAVLFDNLIGFIRFQFGKLQFAKRILAQIIFRSACKSSHDVVSI